MKFNLCRYITASPKLGFLAVEGRVGAVAAGDVIPAGSKVYYSASADGLDAAAAAADGLAHDIIGLAANDGQRLSEERFVNVVISKVRRCRLTLCNPR